ncbi:MAG: hypothetical protein H0W12_11175 [Chitinophagaceae bacterium]|nr:hypothetical protein [Chitinophagaceae bacterium]
MTKSDTIGAIILGAAASVAILRFFNMPKEERDDFIEHLKNRAHDMLDDTQGTIEKVKQHFAEIDRKDQPVDKLLVVKNMLTDLFGSTKRYLL